MIGGEKFRHSCVSVHQFVDDIIEKRHQGLNKDTEKAGRYVFFDAVAQDSKDDSAVRAQLVNVLLAGRDTTACLLSWAL